VPELVIVTSETSSPPASPILIAEILFPDDSIVPVPVLVIIAPDPEAKAIDAFLSAAGEGLIVPAPVIVPEVTNS